ncbi:MAG: hypothetical protein V9E83_13245 [Baekduia sp.]
MDVKQKLAVVAIALVGALGAASSASAAETNCLPDDPSMWITDKFDWSVTPDPWTDEMQGKTVTVTITGKTQGKVPLALASYQAQSNFVLFSFPQTLYQLQRHTLDGCETVTLKVDVPSCYYQVDFIDAEGLTQDEIDNPMYSRPRVINYANGGRKRCEPTPTPNPDPENPPTPNPTPDPNDPQTPYTPPVLPPVQGGSVSGSGTATTPQPVVRACSAVKATSYRVRAKQRNTITVRVTTTSSTKPKVTLKGAGVSTSKRAGSKNTAVFRVRPSRAGSIRVTASGCAKVASVKVLSAKRTKTTGKAPTFTG